MDIGTIYPFIVVSSLAIGLSIALNEWMHGDNVECRRISATFGLALILQTPFLIWDIDALLPFFRPFADTVSLIVILWAFVRPFFDRRQIARFRNILLAWAIAGVAFSFLFLPDFGPQAPWAGYADHWSMLIWHLVQVGLAGLGVWVMFARRREGRWPLMLAFATWVVAHAFSVLGYPDIMIPAHALAYPLITIATYQTVTNDLRAFGEELRSLSQRALSRTKGQIFLLEVSKAAGAPMELSAILQIITDYGGLAFEADRVLLLLHDNEQGQPGYLRVAARYNPVSTEEPASEQTHLFARDYPLIESALHQLDQLVLERSDITALESQRRQGLEDLLGVQHIGALMIQPLVFRQEPIGLVVAARVEGRHTFSEEESRLLGTMASLIAATLENSQLYGELREANANLRQLNEELRAAYQELQSVDQLKSSFIGLITHELRSPFVDLNLSLQLIRRHGTEGFQPAQQELLDQFEAGVAKASQMINSVVSFSSLLSKQGTLHYEETDFDVLVEDAISPLLSMARSRNVTLISQPHSGPVPVKVDAMRVREAMQHLVHNAIKFTDAGGTVAVRYGEGDGGVVFEVEDTGVGIAEEELESIWDRFSQLADPVRRGVEGLGVGLAMVKLIAEKHGGKVMAASQVRAGSTFGFWLPALPPHSRVVSPTTVSAE